MRSKGFDGMVCSVARVMAAIGDRWGLIILRDLVLGLTRFDEFRRSSGITNATLADRLRHLEAVGLVERRRYQHNPERYEYVLTDKGRKVGAIMPMLAQVGDSLDEAAVAAPPLRFVNRRSGAEVRWGLIDGSTGEPLGSADVDVREGPGADDLVRWRLSRRKGPGYETRGKRARPGAGPTSRSSTGT